MKERKRQKERDGGGERAREMREEGLTIKGGGKGEHVEPVGQVLVTVQMYDRKMTDCGE